MVRVFRWTAIYDSNSLRAGSGINAMPGGSGGVRRAWYYRSMMGMDTVCSHLIVIRAYVTSSGALWRGTFGGTDSRIDAHESGF